MRRNKQVALVLLLALASMGSACQQNQNVVQPPTDTQQQAEARAWSKMVDYFGVINGARNTAHDIAMSLSQQTPPMIPVSVLESLVRVDDWSESAIKILQASKDNFKQPIATQVIALADQIIKELATIQPAQPQPTLSVELEKIDKAAHDVKALEVVWTP